MPTRALGVVRRVDELGRVVIPKELRRTMQIEEKDPLEIFVTEDTIVLKKYNADKECMVSGEVTSNPISLYKGKIVVSQEGAKELIKQLQKQIS